MTSRLKDSCLGQLSQPEASKSNLILLFFNTDGHIDTVPAIFQIEDELVPETLQIVECLVHQVTSHTISVS